MLSYNSIFKKSINLIPVMKLWYTKFYSRHFDEGEKKREKVGVKGRKKEGRKLKLKHSLYLYRANYLGERVWWTSVTFCPQQASQRLLVLFYLKKLKMEIITYIDSTWEMIFVRNSISRSTLKKSFRSISKDGH